MTTTLVEPQHQDRERRDRFYEDIEGSHKAEFINGKVIVHSPARRKHSIVQGLLGQLLGTHVDRHQVGEVFQGKT